MAETSGSSAGVMLVLFIPLLAVGFHCFGFFFFLGGKKANQCLSGHRLKEVLRGLRAAITAEVMLPDR